MTGTETAASDSRVAMEQSGGAVRRIGDVDFDVAPFGMLRQRIRRRFDYDRQYLERQSTTPEMSYLRLGFLLSQIPYDLLREFRVLELGPGRGVFFDILKPQVGDLFGFDTVADSPYHTIDWQSAARCKWDLVCGFDVLEHFEEIDRLWELDFRWGYFSLPAPPATGVAAEWRHFKPDEHLWYVTAEQFVEWAANHGYQVTLVGCPEDGIRRRWDESQPNINSFVMRRLDAELANPR